MEQRIVIAGFGGQGVLLIGQVLCYAGMAEGKNVSWLPSYGPEMRGGTASCSVIISDGEIGSPLVTEPTKLIVMNQPSYAKYAPMVEVGGTVYVNSSLIEMDGAEGDAQVVTVPCNEVAHQVGNARTANMAMLGAFIADTGILPQASITEALKKIFGERRAHLMPVNEEAMAKGGEMMEIQ
ncbi:2-oxoacid:acceptor oxidoreductase family protein [Eubacteriales bacterium OttesenSCG-928-M02]|nr:2-oxoacid:acceptor oxidoreductase family protein [Eubacteriales bacterium OttesenSCG-928-M02]